MKNLGHPCKEKVGIEKENGETRSSPNSVELPKIIRRIILSKGEMTSQGIPIETFQGTRYFSLCHYSDLRSTKFTSPVTRNR